MAELAQDRRADDWLSLGHVIAIGGASVLSGPEPLKKLKQALKRGAVAGGSVMETLMQRMKAAGMVKEKGAPQKCYRPRWRRPARPAAT